MQVRAANNVLTVWIIGVIGVRAVTPVMIAPAGPDEDEEFSPVDLFVSVPVTTVVLLEVAVRELRRRGWSGG